MATVTLEALQNELVRDILNIDDMSVLKKIKSVLRREERKALFRPE